jgi:hypothetical protein
MIGDNVKRAGAWVLMSILMLSGCQQDAAKQRAAQRISYDGADADLTLFFDTLGPFGEWIDVPKLGPCWSPRRVPPGWRPYTVGRWCYTNDDGWLWAGSDSWSWATDHFGRWTFLDNHGWVWVPDRIWGPAWVYCFSGGGYVGWAPLPPGQTVKDAREIEPTEFSFVAQEHLTDPKVRDHFEPVTRNVTLVLLAGNASPRGGAGVPVEQIEKATGREVPRYRLSQLSTARPSEVSGGDVGLFQPEIPRRPAVLRAIPPRGRQPGELVLEEHRQRLADYHDALFVAMEQRHRAEEASLPDASFKPDLDRQHAREMKVFDLQRQREVECLRRRQQQSRESRIRAEKEAAEELKRKKAGGPLYEIPPEWQLPPEMLRK